MSKKHNQRTRAEILVKRGTLIVEIPVQKKILAPNGQTLYVPLATTQNADVRRASRSKYTPHFGAKEQARAARCFMSMHLNEQVAQFHPRDGHIRVTPTLCQVGKVAFESCGQEYDSVF